MWWFGYGKCYAYGCGCRDVCAKLLIIIQRHAVWRHEMMPHGISKTKDPASHTLCVQDWDMLLLIYSGYENYRLLINNRLVVFT